MTELTPAEMAVRHILERLVTDRDLSWLLMGTCSLELCVAAEANRRGVTPEAVRRELEASMLAADRRGVPPARLPDLQKKVEQLERRIKDMRYAKESSGGGPGGIGDRDARARRRELSRRIASALLGDATETGHLAQEMTIGGVAMSYDDLVSAIDGKLPTKCVL